MPHLQEEGRRQVSLLQQVQVSLLQLIRKVETNPRSSREYSANSFWRMTCVVGTP
jgi:hypothetical protein